MDAVAQDRRVRRPHPQVLHVEDFVVASRTLLPPAAGAELLVVRLDGAPHVLQTLRALGIRQLPAELLVPVLFRDETSPFQLLQRRAPGGVLAVALVALGAAVGVAAAENDRIVQVAVAVGLLHVLVAQRTVALVGGDARASVAVVRAFRTRHVPAGRVAVLVVAVVHQVRRFRLAADAEEVALFGGARSVAFAHFFLPVGGFLGLLLFFRRELSRVVGRRRDAAFRQLGVFFGESFQHRVFRFAQFQFQVFLEYVFEAFEFVADQDVVRVFHLAAAVSPQQFFLLPSHYRFGALVQFVFC